MSAVQVRAVTSADRTVWNELYRGYRDFYEKPHDPAVFETVWAWLTDPAHGSRGLVAELDGSVVGLAHFRTFARPIDAAQGIYLDDLFTAPSARGSGVAGALLTALAELARDEGASMVRWITAESNAPARRLYDRVAKHTPWVTYDLSPAEPAERR